MTKKLHGVCTALITPLKGGKVDEEAFTRFVEWQISQGVHGLVPSGTTGESPTLDHDEHNLVISLCVEAAKGRVPVIAGTGSNATHEAVSLTQHAQEAGADAALLVSPYYNKPTEEGVYQHYKAIHDNTDIPIILYNVPGRSVIDMRNTLIERLAELPRIVGVKDATGDLSRPVDLKRRLAEKRPDFIQFSGEDDSALTFYHEGGHGTISVSSNVAPAQCAKVYDLFADGQIEAAEELQQSLQPLHAVMFCETSPGPVKYAASLMGHCDGSLRLPMVPPSAENQAKISKTLMELGLM